MLDVHASQAYKACMNTQYTIRGISSRLDEKIREIASNEGKSLNETVLEILKSGTGISGNPIKYKDLDYLAGSWVHDPEFDKAIEHGLDILFSCHRRHFRLATINGIVWRLFSRSQTLEIVWKSFMHGRESIEATRALIVTEEIEQIRSIFRYVLSTEFDFEKNKIQFHTVGIFESQVEFVQRQQFELFLRTGVE
jgi:hypothetical protein